MSDRQLSAPLRNRQAAPTGFTLGGGQKQGSTRLGLDSWQPVELIGPLAGQSESVANKRMRLLSSVCMYLTSSPS